MVCMVAQSPLGVGVKLTFYCAQLELDLYLCTQVASELSGPLLYYVSACYGTGCCYVMFVGRTVHVRMAAT